MATVILCKNYNNYFNRTLKTLAELHESVQNIIAEAEQVFLYPHVNFNQNDGVTTELILNYDDSANFAPDYLLVVDENNNLLSSWFVLDGERTRVGQYKLSLKRDVLGDYWREIKDSPIFIEKAILPESNSLIFNKENISVNQIKKEEVLLKDETENKWIVGYYGDLQEDKTISGTSKSEFKTLKSELDFIDFDATGIVGRARFASGTSIVRYCMKSLQGFASNKWWIRALIPNLDDTTSAFGDWARVKDSTVEECFTAIFADVLEPTDDFYGSFVQAIANNQTVGNELKRAFNLGSSEQLQKLKNINNSIIYDYPKNKYYRLNIINQSKIYEENVVLELSGPTASARANVSSAANQSRESLPEKFHASSFDGTKKSFKADVSYEEYEVFLTEVDATNVETVTLKTTGIKLQDAPFNMFAIPFTEENLDLACQIKKSLGSSCYDIQILPFCPRRDAIDSGLNFPATLLRDFVINSVPTRGKRRIFTNRQHAGILTSIDMPIRLDSSDETLVDNTLKVIEINGSEIIENATYTRSTRTLTIYILDIDNTFTLYDAQSLHLQISGKREFDISNTLEENEDFSFIKKNNQNVSYVIYCTRSSGSFVIPYEYIVQNKKIENETVMMRLNSPNYNSSFEFSPAKNGGIQYFEVNFTYKPFSPFIQVNPNWGGLYGRDFNDARGLICNGDFSIDMISSAWTDYENSNKNFQNIFNAQIKTMDKNNAIQVTEQLITGGMSAITTGIGVGGISGNPLVGIGAGIASAAGGALDISFAQQIYRNNKQLQIDNFGYQLGNIQARPDSLTKVSAYNIVNKYFPFLEIYDCTEEEKEALNYKINFDGMTVMATGHLIDYMELQNSNFSRNFFRGRLIPDSHASYTLDIDTHILNEIATELEKGVFING